MSRNRKNIAPQILDEAAEWFVTMREQDASAENRAAFAEWLRASPVHVGAYLEIAKLWTDASRIDGNLGVDFEAPDNVVPLRELPDASASQHRSSRDGSTRRRARLFAVAASFVLAFVGGATWLYLDRAPGYETDIGEQRTITLEDGSVVRLNSRSLLKVRFSQALREIDLVEGQALFEVAHDTHRPFTVRSGNSTIRAVGTQFDVNRRNTGTVVTVIEGRVKLDVPRSRTPSALLAAGDQIRIAAGTGTFERTAGANTAAAISWLQHELIFEGQPLTDVIEEFNRYTRKPIVLADPGLEDIRINAVFHSTNPESLLRFISRYDNVRVEQTEEEVRIFRR